MSHVLQNSRYETLDSLRGIAAFGVLLTHILQTIIPDGTINHTPLRMLVNGRSFVILFFVLSGFVLAKSIWSDANRTTYWRYAARRLTRLYPPYAMAGVCAAATLWAVNQASLDQILAYFALLGTPAGTSLNSPSWSLVFETRLSLIMPFLCWAILRHMHVAALATLAVFCLEELAVILMGIGQFPYTSTDIASAIIITARFGVCFMLGAFLAVESRWREMAFSVIRRYPIPMAVVAYLLMSVLLDQASMIGAIIVLMLAMEWSELKSVLRYRAFVWMGRISYSLYLTHVVVLTGLSGVLLEQTSILFVAGLAIPVSLIVAECFYRAIEKPSIDLSRRVGRSKEARIEPASSRAASART